MVGTLIRGRLKIMPERLGKRLLFGNSATNMKEEGLIEDRIGVLKSARTRY